MISNTEIDSYKNSKTELNSKLQKELDEIRSKFKEKIEMKKEKYNAKLENLKSNYEHQLELEKLKFESEKLKYDFTQQNENNNKINLNESILNSSSFLSRTQLRILSFTPNLSPVTIKPKKNRKKKHFYLSVSFPESVNVYKFSNSYFATSKLFIADFPPNPNLMQQFLQNQNQNNQSTVFPFPSVPSSFIQFADNIVQNQSKSEVIQPISKIFDNSSLLVDEEKSSPPPKTVNIYDLDVDTKAKKAFKKVKEAANDISTEFKEKTGDMQAVIQSYKNAISDQTTRMSRKIQNAMQEVENSYRYAMETVQNLQRNSVNNLNFMNFQNAAFKPHYPSSTSSRRKSRKIENDNDEDYRRKYKKRYATTNFNTNKRRKAIVSDDEKVFSDSESEYNSSANYGEIFDSDPSSTKTSKSKPETKKNMLKWNKESGTKKKEQQNEKRVFRSISITDSESV